MAMDLSQGRYVFFKNYHSLGSMNNPTFQQQYNLANKNLSNISTALKLDSTYEDSTEKHLGNIRKYLGFIKSMIASLRANEIDFLQDQLRRLPQDSEIRELFPKDGDLSKFNYTQINAAFNAIMQDKNTYQRSMEIQRENMKTIRDSYLHAAKTKEAQARLDKMFEEKYNKYVGEVKRAGYQMDAKRMKEYRESITRQLASRANAVLKNIAGNSEIIGAIETSLKATGEINMNSPAVKTAIVNAITDKVINTPLDIDVNTITKDVITNLTEKTKETFKEMENVEFSRILEPDFKELEELALTTNKSLGEHILKLDATSIKNIKKIYPGISKEIDALIAAAKEKPVKEQKISQLKSNVTSKLKQQIRQRAQKIIGDRTLEQMTKDDFRNLFKNTNNFITPTNFKGGLMNKLSDIKFEHQTIAEILADNDVRKRIAGAIADNIPGVTVSFKADIRFSVGTIEEDAFNLDQLTPAINDIIAKNYSNFLLKYKDKSGGQTDVEKAMQAYNEWLSEMKKEIDEMIDLSDSITGEITDKNKIYEQIYNSFSISISVKDYDVYNDILGFHGGSLGGKKSSEQVMKNITDMYRLGGITELDANALMFAAMNCGDAMIGGSDLRKQLENFLVGGAALLMFDDSFAAAEDYFKSVADEFRGQRIVNIYRLNTEYKTASYVLEGIYQSLLQYYQDLEAESSIEKLQISSRVTIINDVTPEDIPQKGSPEERWKAVSEYTEKNIHISFSFMGGMLDTLNQGPQFS